MSEGDGISGDDLFVAKLSPDGQHVWSRRIGVENAERGPLAGADASGNVIVAGGVGDEAELFGQSVVGSDEGELFVTRLDPEGNHTWSQIVSGAGDGAVSLAIGETAAVVAGSRLDVFLATVGLDGSVLAHRRSRRPSTSSWRTASRASGSPREWPHQPPHQVGVW